MKCIIPGLNVKVIARAIHALCRIGSELYVEAEPTKLSFRAVSSTKSAYASFTFFESFFSYYCCEQGESDEENIICKVSMKSCLAVFRSPTHLDKRIESCQIKLETGAVKLIFEFQCHHGVIKTHYLPIIECETLEAVYSKEMAPNRLVIQPKLLTFSLTNFHGNTHEITWVVSAQNMLLRNYAEDVNDGKKGVRTELCLEPGEFDHYNIGEATSVTFCLKEFRALLQFAEGVSLPISANFESSGRPIVFVVQNNPTFEANFVFATLMPAGNNLNSSQQSTEILYQKNRLRKEKVPKTVDAACINNKTLSNQKAKGSKSNSSIQLNISLPGPSRSNAELQCRSSIEEESEPLPKLAILEERHLTEAEESGEEDTVCGTPPPPPVKRARYIFERCFQSTFNSQMLPGYNEVLAEDSDEECKT